MATVRLRSWIDQAARQSGLEPVQDVSCNRDIVLKSVPSGADVVTLRDALCKRAYLVERNQNELFASAVDV